MRYVSASPVRAFRCLALPANLALTAAGPPANFDATFRGRPRPKVTPHPSMKKLRLALVTFASTLGVAYAQDEERRAPPVEIPDFSNLDEYIYCAASFECEEWCGAPSLPAYSD